MRKIAVVNQKGGVGKTTTAVSLSAALARLGKSVLLVDMDPQSHATLSLGLVPSKQPITTYSLLLGRAGTEAIQKVRENLDLVPANLDLAGAEAELASEIGRETALRSRLEGAIAYDYMFFDTPPSLGLLSLNVLCAANEIFIPVQGEFLSLNGISLLVRTLHLVRKRLNPGLEVTGVIACMHNPRRILAREVTQEIERFFPGRLFKTKIHVNVKLAEAPSRGKTIFEYDPECRGALDYMELAREVLGPAESNRREARTSAASTIEPHLAQSASEVKPKADRPDENRPSEVAGKPVYEKASPGRLDEKGSPKVDGKIACDRATADRPDENGRSEVRGKPTAGRPDERGSSKAAGKTVYGTHTADRPGEKRPPEVIGHDNPLSHPAPGDQISGQGATERDPHGRFTPKYFPPPKPLPARGAHGRFGPRPPGK